MTHLSHLSPHFLPKDLVAQMVKNLPAVRETQVLSQGQEDPPEKGMANHSSILAWRIPWTEQRGRLQVMGSQGVTHSQATSLLRNQTACPFLLGDHLAVCFA